MFEIFTRYPLNKPWLKSNASRSIEHYQRSISLEHLQALNICEEKNIYPMQNDIRIRAVAPRE